MCAQANDKVAAPAAEVDGSMSVIIAANNEEDYIGACLMAVLEQTGVAGGLQVVVVANACVDQTVAVTQSFHEAFSARGWTLEVVETATPGKLNALRLGEQAATGGILVYLDADVRCDPLLLGQLQSVLAIDAPRYATGTLRIARAKSWITRQYARFWAKLPFVKGGAVGAGLFALNRAGRARWGDFPDIISDDTFVRLHFAPEERVEVDAAYHWPMIEGLSSLVRVRRRQDAGVSEIAERFPALLENEQKGRLGLAGLIRLFLRDPLGFAVYGTVHVMVRFGGNGSEWARGR